VTDLTGALCAGRWRLFDSTELHAHRVARKICADCPAIDGCRELLQAALAAPCVQAGSGPIGTWAGLRFGRTVHEVIEPKRSGAKPKPREHGTDRGYYQHRTHREPSCRDCKAAHKLAVWVRAQVCGERVVGVFNPLDNESQETTNASRPRAIGAPTPARGLADRLETTDSWT